MKAGREAAAGNPCPFLRALVGEGLVGDDAQPAGELAATIARVARAGEGEPALPPAAIRAIALIAHGLGPLSIARTAREGVRPGGLRGGPLDKRGVGSGVLDAQARVDGAQLDRLAGFASPKTAADGTVEPGLDLREIGRFMDANFERAAGRRRRAAGQSGSSSAARSAGLSTVGRAIGSPVPDRKNGLSRQPPPSRAPATARAIRAAPRSVSSGAGATGASAESVLTFIAGAPIAASSAPAPASRAVVASPT